MTEPPKPQAKVTVPMVMAGICLAIPFAAMLWVDSYSRLTPAFIGIPFFYWYQITKVLRG
jgi:Protein of unknown function (DUF3311)